MRWIVELSDEFEPELDALHEDVQMEILALTRLLQQFGATLGAAPCGHTERLTSREYERTPVQRGWW